MKATAFAPAHITGLVRSYQRPDDPLHTGSTGIGFSISEGVTTRVEVIPGTSGIEVEINGRPASDAKVSKEVAKSLLSRTDEEHRIRIHHRVDIPIGVGLGTSGAAALSLALAMNEALDLGLSRIETAQAAHLAEVTCRTGLGTVLAEMYGGFEARVSPGAPGFGRIVRIPTDNDYSVVALTFGPLSTDKMLASMDRRNEVAILGEWLLARFMRNRSIEDFLQVSNRFAQFLGLNPRLRSALKKAEKAGFVCGVALFGETVFTLVKPEKTSEVERIFRDQMEKGSKVLISRMGDEGARVVERP